MQQLQIQTRVPKSNDGEDGIVTTIPVKGSLPLKEGHEIKLYLNKRSFGFYVGHKASESSEVYLGNEYMFPEALPELLFQDFTLPVVDFLEFDSGSITGLIEKILLGFLKPQFIVMSDNNRARIEFWCQAVTGNSYSFCLEIPLSAMSESLAEGAAVDAS